MRIEYIRGNLLDARCRVILHGCNAQGVMGSGVAKAVRDKYPGAYESYSNTHRNGGLVLGEVYPYFSADKVILNGITQDGYGTDRRHADYAAIATVIRDSSTFARKIGEIEYAMPLIGAGLAGGDWDIISKIIERESTVNPLVYVLDNEWKEEYK